MKFAILAFVCLSASLGAQEKSSPDSTAPVIQDNSFLVEEAYNQEAGVVQHITTFEKQRGTNDFAASFTQEWPVGSIKHQLSYDLPLLRSGSKTGIGDVGLNYRYQLVGSGETRLAFAPRLSITLPTGDWKRSMGAGAVGFEGNLPLSFVPSPAIALHSNAGISFVPSGRNALGDRARTVGIFAGQSAILTLSPRIQPMLEVVYSRGQEVIAKDKTGNFSEALISPGLRGAFNFASGLQIVQNSIPHWSWTIQWGTRSVSVPELRASLRSLTLSSSFLPSFPSRLFPFDLLRPSICPCWSAW